MELRSHRISLVGILGLGLASAACSPTLAVKGVHAARATAESTLTTTSSGTVEAEQQAILGFTAPGRIKKISAQVGDPVKRDQILAELDNGDLEVVAQDAARDLKRAQELFASGLVSRVALDEAKRSYEIARANLDKTVIRAPFSGIITEKNLELGGLAQAVSTTASNTSKAPIRIVDLEPRIVKGSIDEVDLSKVKIGSPARIKIPAVRSAPFAAVVSRVVPFVSTVKEQDRTSQIELKITDAKQLIPVGASADIEIIVNSKKDVLTIPTRLILGRADQKRVFKLDGSKIHSTTIQTGIGNYDRTEILSGLSEGDVVIFPPAETDLQDGRKVKAEITPWP